MNPMSADDVRSNAHPSSLMLLGEALAATASLANLARLIVRQVRDATGAARVALQVRDESSRLRAAADDAGGDGQPPRREIVALPLVVRGAVEGILVVQDATDRATLETFVPQAASAVGAVRASQTGGSEGAAARARITSQVLHEVNNRLGAIQIYAYLLAERLKRGEDAGGIEIAGKLCGAVERLGTSIGGLATTEAPAAGGRAAADLAALLDGCLGEERVAGESVLARRESGAAGAVMVHEASLGEALRHVVRELGARDGARVGVTTQRLSRAGAIVVDSAAGLRRLAAALFAGENDELGRALLRDVVERQAGTVTVTVSGADGVVLRLELVGATE
jgi:hypothetical protein